MNNEAHSDLSWFMPLLREVRMVKGEMDLMPPV
jgi:hypothetical protein